MIPKRTPTRKRPASGRTRNALKIIDRITGDDAETRRMIHEERLNAEVAAMIHDARTKAGLTQAQLASRVGTTQSVIARLEDADYTGRSLSVLQRIAVALNQRVEVRFFRATRGTRVTVHNRKTNHAVVCRSPSHSRTSRSALCEERSSQVR